MPVSHAGGPSLFLGQAAAALIVPIEGNGWASSRQAGSRAVYCPSGSATTWP